MTLRIRVLDVTEADAPASSLAEVTLPSLSYDAGAEESVSFTVPSPEWDPWHTVIVSVHLDKSGSGEVETGDALTTRAEPSSEAPLSLRLTPVRDL